MKKLTYCSQCGKKNSFNLIDGGQRYHCNFCKTIHYQNPKPTATLICPKEDSILLGRRKFSPGKGEWGLPGGFVELSETLFEAGQRELKEETNLEGKVKRILSTCSHYGTIFGDILLIGVEMEINDYSTMKAGDDAAELQFFDINDLPHVAFYCHKKFIDEYKSEE